MLRAGSVKNLSEDHVILNEVKNLNERDAITTRCFTSFNMTMCFMDRHS